LPLSPSFADPLVAGAVAEEVAFTDLSSPTSPQFVEDDGDVLFYKDAYGRTPRKVLPEDPPSDSGVELD
jgi:hypothetical protein